MNEFIKITESAEEYLAKLIHDKNETDSGHLVQSCLVVLALYAKVEQEDGTEKIIPIWTNNFRNSPLGVKPLRYKVSD